MLVQNCFLVVEKVGLYNSSNFAILVSLHQKVLRHEDVLTPFCRESTFHDSVAASYELVYDNRREVTT